MSTQQPPASTHAAMERSLLTRGEKAVADAEVARTSLPAYMLWGEGVAPAFTYNPYQSSASVSLLPFPLALLDELQQQRPSLMLSTVGDSAQSMYEDYALQEAYSPETQAYLFSIFDFNQDPTRDKCEAVGRDVGLTAEQVKSFFVQERERLKYAESPALTDAFPSDLSVNGFQPSMTEDTNDVDAIMLDAMNTVDDLENEERDLSSTDLLNTIVNELGGIRDANMMKSICVWVLAERSVEEKRRFLAIVSKSSADVLQSAVESKVLPGIGNWCVRAIKEGDAKTTSALIKTLHTLPVKMAHFKSSPQILKAVKAIPKHFIDQDLLRDVEALKEKWTQLQKLEQEQEIKGIIGHKRAGLNDGKSTKVDGHKKRSIGDEPIDNKRQKMSAKHRAEKLPFEIVIPIPKFSRVTRPPPLGMLVPWSTVSWLSPNKNTKTTSKAENPIKSAVPDIFSALIPTSAQTHRRFVAPAKPKLQVLERSPPPDDNTRAKPSTIPSNTSPMPVQMEHAQPSSLALLPSFYTDADSSTLEDTQQRDPGSLEVARAKGMRIRHKEKEDAVVAAAAAATLPPRGGGRSILKRDGMPKRRKLTIRWRDNEGGELCAIKIFHKGTTEEEPFPHQLGVTSARESERLEGRQAFGREKIEPKIGWNVPKPLILAVAINRGANSTEKDNDELAILYASESSIPSTPASPPHRSLDSTPVRTIGKCQILKTSSQINNSVLKQFFERREASSPVSSHTTLPGAVPSLPSNQALQNLISSLAMIQSNHPTAPAPTTSASGGYSSQSSEYRQSNSQHYQHPSRHPYRDSNSNSRSSDSSKNHKSSRNKKKNKVPSCVFYRNGRCQKGDACAFRHD